MIHHGDCVEVMAGMDAESVDAIVTDPPYDLTSQHGPRPPQYGNGVGAQEERENRGNGGFMSMRWDGEGVAFRRETWEAAYRVAKPSAYLLAFGGTRTVHRMTVALEDAGWIIRDMLVWGYASGFPKSKASLKPAWEPIVMARKPGPLRMLAIDECRIGTETTATRRSEGEDGTSFPRYGKPPGVYENELPGRWPANIVLTDPIFDGGIEGVVGGGETGRMPGNYDRTPVNRSSVRVYGNGDGIPDLESATGFGDSGTYSRFFLIPKAARSDREPVLGGLPEVRRSTDYGAMRKRECNVCASRSNELGRGGTWPACEHDDWSWVDQHATGHKGGNRQNSHPTVKPTDLMRHLVRLVTPVGGIVLDPFLGSGTTALAAEMEGFEWIGIEREAEYVAIAEARLNGTQRGLGLG